MSTNQPMSIGALLGHDLSVRDAFSEFLKTPNEETQAAVIESVLKAKEFLDTKKEECDCICHRQEGVLHFVPCC